MKKYSSYKNSGVNHLETIPSNWTVSRIRMVGKLYGGLTGKKGDDFNNIDNPSNKPFIPFTNIFNNTYISNDQFQLVNIDENENQNRVKKNDIFFLMSSESYEDLGKCSIILEEVEELYLNSFCKGFRIKDETVYPLFLNYQLVGNLHKELISIEGNGFTRINLRQDRLLDIPVFIPPYKEQKKIVQYLDIKTTLIDSLIKNKTEKIKTLKEKRISLISKVVTKGIQSDSDLKDSGIDWVGEIPQHWIVTQLRYGCSVNYGITLQLEKGKTDGIKILTVRNLSKEGQWKFEEEFRIDEELVDEEDMLQKGDLLFNWRNGSIDHVGKTGIFEIDEPYTHVSFLLRIRSKKISYNRYIYYYLNNLRSLGVFGSSKQQVNQTFNSSELKMLRIVLPPIEEQQEIVKYLDQHTKEIDDLIELELNKIELLREYRQSLISEVVTGKIRVCDEDLSEIEQTV